MKSAPVDTLTRAWTPSGNTWKILSARRLAAVAAACLLCLPVGCSTLKPDWKWMGESEPVIPEMVLPIWTDTVLHQPGESGIRGFGGRVYFYAEKGGDPVKVDGSLIVYVFDGDEYQAASSEPQRKFVFTADQLANHHSTNELGDSYSIWIPWDKVGGPSKSLSLIVRFDGRNGGTAISDASSKLLPGTPKHSDVAKENKPSPIQQVAFENQTEEETASSSTSQMKSYSLSLPPSFRRHMIGPPIDPAVRQPIDSSVSRQISRPTGPVAAEFPEATAVSEQAAASKEVPKPESDSESAKSPVRKTLMSQRVFAPRPSEQARAEWRSGLPPTPRSQLNPSAPPPPEHE